MVTDDERKKNIRKAIKRVRDAQGGLLVPAKVARGVTGTGRGGSGGSSGLTPSIGRPVRQQDISNQQRQIAVKKIGSIRRVTTRLERNKLTGRLERVKTFVGVGGRKFTFPEKGLSFTARQKFGGLRSREVPITPSISRARERRINTRISRQQDKIIQDLLRRQQKKRPITTPKVTRSDRDILLNKLANASGELTAQQLPKGIIDKGLRALRKEKERQFTDFERSSISAERIFIKTAIAGVLGGTRAILQLAKVVRNPIQTAKGLISAGRHPIQTVKVLKEEFVVDPVGTVVEFFTFNKALGLAGKGISRSPVGRFVQEEMFIRSQPKQIRGAVRKIIKGSKAQEKLNPTKIKLLKEPDFAKVKSLTKAEAKALTKTLQETDSVVFGSAASRTISRGKTPIPKDVDLATKSINLFNKKFIKNLPKKIRNKYVLKGQKIVRLTNKEAIMDVKPLSRLIPERNLITGKGRLPVVGFVKKITRKKGSILPKVTKKPGISKLTVPTQKIVKTKGGIRLTGFGEQTTRKGLGTLQVLIEKNFKRAKDPQSFLISLEVQLKALKKVKPKTPFGRISKAGKVKSLDSAIKLLKSKSFARLLEKKVPGINKEFPMVAKISTSKLKKINLNKVKKAVKKLAKKKIKPVTKAKGKKSIKRKKVTKKPTKKKIKTIPKKTFQKIQSKLPKTARKFVRSKLPSRLPSRVPVRVYSGLSSRLKKTVRSQLKRAVRPSKIPKSKVPKRKKPKSRLPKRKPRPSRLPVSKIPQSKLISRLPSTIRSNIPSVLTPATSRLLAPKIKKAKRKLFERKERRSKTKTELKKKLKKSIIRFIYTADIVSLLFGSPKPTQKQIMKLLKVGRKFTGLEIRPVLRGRRIIKRAAQKVRKK